MFLKPAQRALEALPETVRAELAQAIYAVAEGKTPKCEKVLSGFGSAKVRELKADHKGNTYRAVIFLEVADCLYVIDAFEKKSHKGGRVPKEIAARIENRISFVRSQLK